MQRWFRTLLWAAAVASTTSVGYAQMPIVDVSGRIAPNEVRVFVKDTLYRINGRYTVAGALLIEPGTTVEFHPNGQLIDSVGGRIIADGRVTGTFLNPYDPNSVRDASNNPVYPLGYADLNYFADASVTNAPNINEPTVNTQKANSLFRVNLGSDSRLQNLTPAKAILYKASRIERVNEDGNLITRSWSRAGGANVNVRPARITFRGTPLLQTSREWGHIVVLPGAEAAYFRDVDFENFRKDTTVDRHGRPFYGDQGSGITAGINNLNRAIISQTSGSGGALTTFSSRTWLVNCGFENNLARYHGGAVQFLQAPQDAAAAVYPNVSAAVNALPSYPASTNPNIIDEVTGQPIAQDIKAIDRLADGAVPEPLSNHQRQAADDGRLAIYLGRIRQLEFRNNVVLNAGITLRRDNGGQVVGVKDDTVSAIEANPTFGYKNDAFGGAVYIEGRTPMTVGLGINNGFGPQDDFVLFEKNQAVNLQARSAGAVLSSGARGGAVYVAGATTMIFTGRFDSNMTDLKVSAELAARLQMDEMSDRNNTSFETSSLGGAIYTDTFSPQLFIRGGQDVVPGYEMHFVGNQAGRGGAIYTSSWVSTTPQNRPSPIVGGADTFIPVRNFGFNIKFLGNFAHRDGGAIYANRNVRINGAGGTFGTSVNYGNNFRVEFANNQAGLSGGALFTTAAAAAPREDRAVDIARTYFHDNFVGLVDSTLLADVRGGGAVYSINTFPRYIKGVTFEENIAYNGNGGAIAIINMSANTDTTLADGRYFLSDLDQTAGSGFNSVDLPYVAGENADVRSLTRFIGNKAVANLAQMGNGATQPQGQVDRTHPTTALPENGTGLGGAVYVLDRLRSGRNDRIEFNRVRFQNNEAYSGAVFYSDNYDLKLVLQRSLVTGNVATSDIGRAQDVISGPLNTAQNIASSDLAGAVMYGEILGPLPKENYHIAANAIYDNDARFLIRLPDAPNTKGVLAGTTGIGFGGVDTLRGNYWGYSDVEVTTIVPFGREQNTFFVKTDENNTSYLTYVQGGANVTEQGPFESVSITDGNGNTLYNYTAIPVGQIPDTLLQQGAIYDIFDKGTDVKTADYSNRRLSRVEDFAVGIPPALRLYNDPTEPSFGKAVKRWVRDPFVADVDADVARLQTEFRGEHPIGYPLFLEAQANYSGDANRNNNDPLANHETVFFVINRTTGDFIRVNLEQVEANSETFRGRAELVPDSINRAPADRRTAEGLANFGGLAALFTFLTPDEALSVANKDGGAETIFDAARNEDIAALRGRKYMGSQSTFGGINFDYWQNAATRSGLPASALNSRITYFAGEKYSSLPVLEGDEILVISRTILWREGANRAIQQGLSFTVSATAAAPEWTGNAVQLQNITTPELRNMVFLTEDINYNRGQQTQVQGRDSIFVASAIDVNRFWDPRSLTNPSQYSHMTYEWELLHNGQPAETGLTHWLQADTVHGDTYYGASGYLRFKGRPTNPFVVPGGETVRVRATSWTPTARMVDSLKAVGYTDEEIAKYFYVYRPYLSTPSYDAANARYIQQDTVNFAAATAVYDFKIFVTDSLPVFTTEPQTCDCPGKEDVLVVNVTDSLRFDIDINTDDEAEDEAARLLGWQFPYGKTSYGYQTIETRINPDDVAGDAITKVRPFWMDAPFLRDENGDLDLLGESFADRGIIKVRIGADEATTLLTPFSQANGNLNVDTVFTVVANDGHGGINSYSKKLFVNFAPRITTVALEEAVEDNQYNFNLLDSNRAIKVYDPNFGQEVRYRLVYEPETGVNRDDCYPEAGNFDALTSNASTPTWLNIDPISGRLFGTPGVLDVPKDTLVDVTVIAEDACGLRDARTLQMRLLPTFHAPKLLDAPALTCVTLGSEFTLDTDIFVVDRDLLRTSTTGSDNDREELTITVTPAGLVAVENVIRGPLDTDTASFRISGILPAGTPVVDGKVAVTVTVRDQQGNQTTQTFLIAVSENTDFESRITVTNESGAEEVLEWGIAPNATTGEEEGNLGQLDSRYCEFELPPIPPGDVFDARWAISNNYGTLRNIAPRSFPTSTDALTAIIQPGGDGSAARYPLRITWDASVLPATAGARGTEDLYYYLVDGNTPGNGMKVNMHKADVSNSRVSNGITLSFNGSNITVTIFANSRVDAFRIIPDVESSVVGVENPVTGDRFALGIGSPNPVQSETVIPFAVASASNVTIEIFDALGNKVKTLVNNFYAPGAHSAMWDGRDASGKEVTSGVYTYRMTAGSHSFTQKLVVVR